MWELDCEESWAPKNWCFWTVVLEKTRESPLDCKEIQPVHSEGNQHWDFFGRIDAKAETPVLWPPHAKSWLIGKDSDAGRDWGQEEKGMTEDEITGWHHWLDGRESEWTPGVEDGQGGLVCCDSGGHKGSDTTEWLNWTDTISWASMEAQTVKNLPTEQETGVWSLSWKDHMEKEMATHSSILAWRNPWTEEPGGLQSMGSQRDGHDWSTKHAHTHISKWPWAWGDKKESLKCANGCL